MGETYKEIAFTVNTTQELFTHFLTEALKKPGEFIRHGISESGESAVMLTVPDWGNGIYAPEQL